MRRMTTPVAAGRAFATTLRARRVTSVTERAAATDERLFDEELLARLRRLALLSRRTIAEGLVGEHRSRRRGSAPEFADFKSYSQGDDFRRIDWNAYARFDSLFVRLSEVTTELSVHVLLDASNSMAWRGGLATPSKFSYARRIAGSLGYVSLWHFDRVVVAPFGETLTAQFGPAQGRARVVPMLRYLEQLAPQGRTDLPTIFDAYVRGRTRPGMLILLSDLLSGEPAQFGEVLRTARGRGWETIVVHVLDAAELAPAATLDGDGDRQQATELIDVESGERLRLRPTTEVMKRYEAALASWLDEIATVCEDADAEYLRLMTDWPFETLVLRLLHERSLVA